MKEKEREGENKGTEDIELLHGEFSMQRGLGMMWWPFFCLDGKALG